VNKLHSYITTFFKADIVKVFSLTSISTLIKMLTGFVSIKVVSVIIGPAGIALLGQLNNFSTIILNLSSVGINNGVTKYISEFKEDENQITKLISGAFKIILWGALLCGIFMIIMHKYLSHVILNSEQFGYIFIIFGLSILFYAVNNLLVSILNGYKEFQRYVKINIVSSLLGLIFSICLVLFFELDGALVSAVTFQSIMLVVTFFMLRKLPWMSKKYFFSKVDVDVVKKYIRYSIMTIVSVAVVPVSQLVLRSYVISNISEIDAGWWEGMNRISGMYLMLITTSFSVYYLPRLSEIQDRYELRREIINAFKVIVPLILVGFLTIYLLRDVIINLLFTKEFAPMSHLFIWQLLGDFFKICSWLLAYVMVAKALAKAFIFTEIAFSFLFVALGFYFIQINGIEGIVQAYLINYIVYFFTILFILRKFIFIKK
jgi:PST family polysaccharide transporter